MEELNKLMEEFGKQAASILLIDTATIRAGLDAVPLTNETEADAEEAAKEVQAGILGLLDATDAYKAEYMRCVAAVLSGLSKAAALCAK